VTSAWFEPGYRGGGPVRSVAAIVDTVAPPVEVVLVTSDRDLGDAAPYAEVPGGWTRRGRAWVHRLDAGSPGAWWRLLRDLRRQRFDLLYVNSLWGPQFTLVFLAASSLRLLHVDDVLIAPRGELTPGALSLKSRKKGAFLRLTQPLLRSRRVQWHASTAQEAAQIRLAVPSAKVIVVEPQISLPERSMSPPVAHGGVISLVFLSRITAKKNLELVVRCLDGLSLPATLDVYGPIEDFAYWRRCLAIIDQLPKHIRVAYCGEVRPAEVRSTFLRYDAFVFPTLGENFGHVIAESLSAACPVLCSAETPWTAVLENGGGTVLYDCSVKGMTRELSRLAAMGPAERRRGRQAAGGAYDEWRCATLDANVIDVWRSERREKASGRPRC